MGPKPYYLGPWTLRAYAQQAYHRQCPSQSGPKSGLKRGFVAGLGFRVWERAQRADKLARLPAAKELHAKPRPRGPLTVDELRLLSAAYSILAMSSGIQDRIINEYFEKHGSEYRLQVLLADGTGVSCPCFFGALQAPTFLRTLG